LPNSKDIRTIPETQGNSEWIPPRGTLGELVTAASVRATRLEPSTHALKGTALAASPVPSLEAALRRSDVALIAEIKRASPSHGEISPGLDAGAQAAAYARGGASAISVLTESERFGGHDGDLQVAARSSRLPILRKDFHVAAAQLYQARALGASAALLIARALEPAVFERLMAAARSVGLEIVAEVRDLAELDRALGAGARIIGVNNRNLETLEIEAGTAESIIPAIPGDCIAVAESGYASRDSIGAVARSGADAVLIGSFLSAANDPAGAVRHLVGIQRMERGR
jgi:indole-3-glycerol phosphate synthase